MDFWIKMVPSTHVGSQEDSTTSRSPHPSVASVAAAAAWKVPTAVPSARNQKVPLLAWLPMVGKTVPLGWLIPMKIMCFGGWFLIFFTHMNANMFNLLVLLVCPGCGFPFKTRLLLQAALACGSIFADEGDIRSTLASAFVLKEN